MRRLRRVRLVQVGVLGLVFAAGLGSASWAAGKLAGAEAPLKVLQIHPTFAPLAAKSGNRVLLISIGVRRIPPGSNVTVNAPHWTLHPQTTSVRVVFKRPVSSGNWIAITITRPRTEDAAWFGFYEKIAVTSSGVVPRKRLCVTLEGKLHSLPCPRPAGGSGGSGSPSTTSTKPTTTLPTTTTTKTTPTPPLPPAPTGVTATLTGPTSFTLSWNAVSGVNTYVLYLDGARLFSVGPVTSVPYGSFQCGTTYTPGVQSQAADGQVSSVATAPITTSACGGGGDTTPPSAPSNLTKLFPSETGFILGWSASSDNVAVTGYNVYIAGSLVATVDPGSKPPPYGNLGYQVSGLSCGTTYQVAVSAFDAAGNNSVQAALSAATTACPSAVPAPTGVTATLRASNDIFVSWNAVSGATGYYLWLDGQQLLQVSGTSFDYGPFACGKMYTPGVQTIASGGQVSAVTTTTITTAAC